MPCRQDYSMSVTFKAKHADLLKKALKSLNLPYQEYGSTISVYPDSDYIRIDIDLANGQARLRDDRACRDMLNRIRRAYTNEAIKKVANVGWKVTFKTGGTAGKFTKGKDSMDFKVESDGTLSIQTGEFTGANHHSADEFLGRLKDILGGDVKALPRAKSAKPGVKAHFHQHGGIFHHH